MKSDELQLGPTQREVYEILEDDGGELRRGEIAEQSDRLSGRAVGRAVERLVEIDLVEKHKVDVRGWFAYRAARGESA